MPALSAVFTVFRAGTRLNAQERAHLYRIWIEILAVNGLSPEEQIVERRLIQS